MKTRILFVAAFVPLLAGVGIALATRHDDTGRARWALVGHVRPPGLYSGDVVVHRGAAYLSSHRGRNACPAQGVRVYSLRDPASPRLVSTFGRIPRTWTEKTIVRRIDTAGFHGDLAATSVQACEPGAFQGFLVTDVTRPAAPRILARVHTDPRGSHEIWLAQAGRRAFVYTAIIASELRSSPDGVTPGRPDFRIFDVSRPAAPREVGGWGAWKTLGIVPFKDPKDRLNGNIVHSVITNAAATRAYLSYWNLGTVILDITDPSDPRYLGRTAATHSAHSAWLGRNGLLVETHETDNGLPTLYDVSDPAQPRRLSDFTLPDSVLAAGHRAGGLAAVSSISLTDSVHDAKIDGDTAFFSWYGQGVVAADVSDPSKPRFLARFLPRPADDRETLLCPGKPCVAVWGMDVDGDLVVASDLVSGLWVLRFRR